MHNQISIDHTTTISKTMLGLLLRPKRHRHMSMKLLSLKDIMQANKLLTMIIRL